MPSRKSPPSLRVVLDRTACSHYFAQDQAMAKLFDLGSEGNWTLFIPAVVLPHVIESLETDAAGANGLPAELSALLERVQVIPFRGDMVHNRLRDSAPQNILAALVLEAAARVQADAIVTFDPYLLAHCAEALPPEKLLAESPSAAAPNSLPFVDLACQQSAILQDVDRRIDRVLQHGRYIMGPEVAELEGRLARYVGSGHAIACASGTDALILALMALEVGPGDLVFTTPFTFISTAEAISLLGAVPAFVDIDPQTFNMNPDKLAAAVRASIENDPGLYPLPAAADGEAIHPKAVIAVDLFGLPADYNRINAVAEEHGLLVIEDAAQSFGADYFGKKAGALADIGCTSFFPAKPLGCYGDGGMCFTDNDRWADVMRSLLLHGKGGHKYEHVRIGTNARLDTLQAAILLAKLEVFPQELEWRRSAADRYTERLRSQDILTTPHVSDGLASAWAQYSLLAVDESHRSRIQSGLQEAGVPTAVYYPIPLHLQTAFQALGYQEGDFPVSEDCARRIFSLPMHPYLDAGGQKRILDRLEPLVRL
jgi:UDP-2-acetamido-2-deoxy-ribo-hexuluronate aminotransferase